MGEVTRGARSLVLCPDIRSFSYDLDAKDRLAEAEGLALAIGVEIEHSTIIPIRQMQPNITRVFRNPLKRKETTA